MIHVTTVMKQTDQDQNEYREQINGTVMKKQTGEEDNISLIML